MEVRNPKKSLRGIRIEVSSRTNPLFEEMVRDILLDAPHSFRDAVIAVVAAKHLKEMHPELLVEVVELY